MAQLIHGTTINGHIAIHAGNMADHSIATTSYVTTQINNLINGAPGALNTLDELAAALGDDASFATSVTTSLAGKLSNDPDSEQDVGGRYFRFNNGGNRINIDPRWNESGYDADMGVFHMYSTTAAGAQWGRTGLALYTGSAYQYLTTKANTTGIFLNDREILTTGNIGSYALTSYSETDPTVPAHVKSITTTEKSNWNTAYGWGNHASAGYLTSLPSHNHDGVYVNSYTTSAGDIDGDWGQSFKTFDPVPSGTPPIASPNLRTINVGNDFNRRTQLAFTYATDQAWFRRRNESGWQVWREFIHSGNIGSQSVSSAASAGNADTVDGYHATNAAGGLAVINANGYWYAPSWINVGSAGIFSSTNNAHILPNVNSPHGAWEMIGSRGGWSAIYFRDSGNTLMANSNDSGFYNVNAGWQIEWYNGTLSISKQANGGGTLATVLDSVNYTSYAAAAGHTHDDRYYTESESDSRYIIKGSTQNPGAWTEATKFKSTGDIGTDTSSNHSLQVYADTGTDAFMAFHISGDYAVFFGLDDSTNRLYTGGWSAGGNKYQIWDSRDFSSTNISNWNTAYGWGNHAGLYAASSHTHDDRYYTESESDTRFVNASGDSMSGSLTLGAGAAYVGTDGAWTGEQNKIQWHSTHLYLQNRGGGNFFFRRSDGTNILDVDNGGNLIMTGGIYPSGQTSYYLYQANSGLWTNGNFGASGDLYLGTRSTWLSSWLNQSVQTGASPTFANLTVNGYVGNWGGQSRDKLRVWDSSEYTIGMKNGYSFGHIASGEYAMSFQMNNNSGRGFWWGDTAHNDAQGAAALTTDGRMNIARSLSIGEGESATEPSAAPLYVRGQVDNAEVLAVDGVNGRLFTVTDSVLDTIYSVNTIAGLPILEVLADSTVKIGKYGNATTFNNDGTVNFQNEGIKIPYYNGGHMWFRTNTHWASISGIDVIGGAGEFRISSDTGSIDLRVDGGFVTGAGTTSGQWDIAYNKRPTGIAFSGGSTKTLTLTHGDGSTISATFNDIDTDTNSDGQTLSISGSTLTISGGNSVTIPSGGISQATADGLYVSVNNNSSLNSDSRNTRGVTRLYRYDDNSDYSLQHYWTGSYWYLRGFSGDTFHAGVQVAYANDAGNSATTSQRSFDYLYATSYLESAGAVYGTIFYDNNDRAYYVDPNSTSKLVQVNLGTVNTRLISDSGVGYLKIYGSASNYLGIGPYDNNGWVYFENSSNANGIYFNSPGRYAFDTVDVTPYTDAENSLGNGSYRWAQVYTSGWLRQYGAQGMYNQDYGTHFYSNGTGSWGITGSGGNVELQFRSNHQTTVRGYVYADTGNNIGFLTNGGSWALRTDSSSNAQLYGSDFTIGLAGAGATNIIMKDSDEGDRVIHCNSNRIGFLNQSGSWGAWCDDTGNWRTGNDMHASYFYGSGSIRLGDMWGGAGLYRPDGSMVFGIENSDWVFSARAVTQAYFAGGDGNLWMRWAGDWLSNLLGAKQNASTAITTSNISSQSVSYASNSGAVSGVGVSTLRGLVGYNSISFYVNGDANTYYPVVLSLGGQFGMNRYSVSRGYSDPAPWDPIGTGSHRGGLTLTFDASSDIAWGGNDKSWRIVQFAESYTTMVAGMALPVTEGIIVWLRGGGAYYTLQGPNGVNHSATVYYSTYTAANGATYPVRTDTSNVTSEIRSKWPIRGFGDGDIYVNNNAVIHAGNIGSQSVNNADTVDGFHAAVAATANTIPTRNSSGYLIPESWIQFNGIYGLYSPTNNAHLRPNNGSYGSWLMTGTRNGWQGIEFDSGSTGNITMMVATDSNTVGFHNNSYGWQIRWANGTLYVGKNSYGGNDATVLDSSNYNSYSPTLTGGNASGTWSINISGTAARATRANGNFYIDDNYGNTVVGVYASTRFQGVFAMGDAYKLSADGTSCANHYGIAWSHPNAGGEAANLTNHGMLVQNVGRTWTAISDTIWCIGDIKAFSDARVKTNIEIIDNPLERLSKVRGVTFNRTDLEHKDKRYAGVIAQEMREALPEAVSENANGELSVSYGNTVSLLIESIKAQQVQIEELKSEVKKLRGE